MDEIICKEFINEFGLKDNLKEIITYLIIESSNNIKRRINGEFYKKIPDDRIMILWKTNKHKYNKFISNMMGKLFTLYNFNDEYSFYYNDYVKNIDISFIDSGLKNYGYHILDKKFDSEKCIKIKEKLQTINFKPKHSTNNTIIGKDILYKNIVIENSSTYWVNDQQDIISINEISEIITDPLILKIVQNYLGCNPIICLPNIWYSNSAGRPDITQEFHQDYDDINFLKIFIYLTDVNKNCGPHSYISTSINNIMEPPGYTVSSRITEKYAKETYGNKIKLFTGEEGTIIIENTNGYHRGMPVINGHRLILQLLYTSSLLPIQHGYNFFNIEQSDFIKKYPNCFLFND